LNKEDTQQEPESNLEGIPRQLKQPKESIDKQLMAGHSGKHKYKKVKRVRQGAPVPCLKTPSFTKPALPCCNISFV
jgi:hypothetical protein